MDFQASRGNHGRESCAYKQEHRGLGHGGCRCGSGGGQDALKIGLAPVVKIAQKLEFGWARGCVSRKSSGLRFKRAEIRDRSGKIEIQEIGRGTVHRRRAKQK